MALIALIAAQLNLRVTCHKGLKWRTGAFWGLQTFSLEHDTIGEVCPVILWSVTNKVMQSNIIFGKCHELFE